MRIRKENRKAVGVNVSGRRTGTDGMCGLQASVNSGLKSQKTSSKYQTNHKEQIPMTVFWDF
jgi:hypothetical protein